MTLRQVLRHRRVALGEGEEAAANTALLTGAASGGGSGNAAAPVVAAASIAAAVADVETDDSGSVAGAGAEAPRSGCGRDATAPSARRLGSCAYCFTCEPLALEHVPRLSDGVSDRACAERMATAADAAAVAAAAAATDATSASSGAVVAAARGDPSALGSASAAAAADADSSAAAGADADGNDTLALPLKLDKGPALNAEDDAQLRRDAIPRPRRGAAASCCLCPCCHPRCYIDILTREVLLTVAYTAITAVSIWLIILGTAPHLENVAWAAMLAFGLAGLAAMYHGLRIRAAARLRLVSSRTIRRYLRLHHPL